MTSEYDFLRNDIELYAGIRLKDQPDKAAVLQVLNQHLRREDTNLYYLYVFREELWRLPRADLIKDFILTQEDY